MTSSMEEMTMRVADLVEAIQKNREEHRDKFLKAQAAYRAKAIEELDRMLAEARGGLNIRRSISLPEPHDHTGDYDTALRMLGMCVDKEVQITARDFQQYVLDEWGWKAGFSATNAAYAIR